uniref:Uncharacterized protein n=1 Tax=Strigamia maritima TaxID=126957 RepID=T1J1X1_STRMM
MCKSKNAETAKIALLKRDLNKLNKSNDERKDKEKSTLLRTVLFDTDNKLKTKNGMIKISSRTSPVKYLGKPVTTPAPKNYDNMTPKWDKNTLSSRSRQRSPTSSDSSPIRRIGRCANKLQSIYNGSENQGSMNNQRLDKLIEILKKLSTALDALETKVSAKVDEEGDKPKLDSIGNVGAFNEQLLSEFCRLVNLFQNVTQQLDKERNLREQLSLEVVRQGNLIEELSVIEHHQSQPNSERITKHKTRGELLGPETCRVRRDGEKPINYMKYITKGSISLPSILEQPMKAFAPSPDSNVRPTANQISPLNEHQSRKRSNLAIAVSRSQLVASGEEMAAIISTVCSTDRCEMRGAPLANATSLTYIVEDTHQSAIMLTLPQQRDTRHFEAGSMSSLSERKSKDFILLEMNASWLPDTKTLRRSSPHDWKNSSLTNSSAIGGHQWSSQEPMPQTPPPSREHSPLSGKLKDGSEVSDILDDENCQLITDCRAPFPYDDSPTPMTLDLFQESTDMSEMSCHTLENDRESNVIMSSSAEGEFMSDSEPSEVKVDSQPTETKRRLDMEELLSKLEALQTHYMSAHIKLQSLVDRSPATNSPTMDNDVSRDLTPRCHQKSG